MKGFNAGINGGNGDALRSLLGSSNSLFEGMLDPYPPSLNKLLGVMPDLEGDVLVPLLGLAESSGTLDAGFGVWKAVIRRWIAFDGVCGCLVGD